MVMVAAEIGDPMMMVPAEIGDSVGCPCSLPRLLSLGTSSRRLGGGVNPPSHTPEDSESCGDAGGVWGDPSNYKLVV